MSASSQPPAGHMSGVFGVGTEGNSVILVLPEDCIAMVPPEQAVDMALSLLKNAIKAGYHRTVTVSFTDENPISSALFLDKLPEIIAHLEKVPEAASLVSLMKTVVFANREDVFNAPS